MNRHRSPIRGIPRRVLVFDVLEDRRVFAGLDVLVYDDPHSLRAPQVDSSPVSQRLVYLDLNSDGAHQFAEPLASSDARGIASFRGLDAGAYSVRLLGNSPSFLQTSPSAPAPSGRWTEAFGVVEPLYWESDSLGWFATNDGLIKLDVGRGSQLEQIPLGGQIESIAMLDQSQGVAMLLGESANRELVRFDLANASVQRWSLGTLANSVGVSNSGYTTSLVRVANDVLLQVSREATSDNAGASSLYEVRWGGSTGTSTIELISLLDGLPSGAQVRSVAGTTVLIDQPQSEGTNLQVYHWSPGNLELTAERFFDAKVRVSSTSGTTDRIAIQTPDGLEVLGLGSGLPTLLRLDQGAGPSVFDLSRQVLWSLSKFDSTKLMGWSLLDGLKMFERSIVSSDSMVRSGETRWGLGYRDDTLIGVSGGSVYTHRLSEPQPFIVELIDSVIEQVSIGLRDLGVNTPPVLQPLPGVTVVEDTPVRLSTADWVRSVFDRESDSIQWVLVRGGALGTIQWSTSTGGQYTPNPNVNGYDTVVVQAYDGRDWSAPQTVGIQIQPVNDQPSQLAYSGVLSIPEQRPGYVLGNVAVVDPDSNEVYDYSVSDPRFEVVGTTLRVREDAQILYGVPGWIDIVLKATSRANGDSIHRSERIFVIQDLTPYHNDYMPADVDRDGVVSPLDPLIIINYINSNGAGEIQSPGEGESPGDLDVDGDGRVSPLDILIVINTLNQGANGEGERVEGGVRKPVAAPLPDEKLKGFNPR